MVGDSLIIMCDVVQRKLQWTQRGTLDKGLYQTDVCVCHCSSQSVTWVLAVKYICIIIIPIDPSCPTASSKSFDHCLLTASGTSLRQIATLAHRCDPVCLQRNSLDSLPLMPMGKESLRSYYQPCLASSYGRCASPCC